MSTESSFYSSIIWPPLDPSEERPRLPPRSSQWWDLFRGRLNSDDIRRVKNLKDCSEDIVVRLPDPLSWGSERSPFKGLVVGAVQSGKTESMIGVSSVALDQGYKVIIVLTGNNEDLRTQTALRFNTHLLGQSDRRVGLGNVFTISDSTPGRGPLGGYAPPYYQDATDNAQLALRIDKYLRRDEPVLVVVKKEQHNLEAMGGALRGAIGAYSSAVPILVLDDECDEGSVGASGPSNPIPEAIERLWHNSSEQLRVAYVGYTATAAANLLQDTSNPLYPSEFAYLLRYPGESDSALVWEQTSFDAWYTGGDIFYRRLGLEAGDEANFIVREDITEHQTHPQDNETLYEALIAYFVSGAYRLLLQEKRSFEDPTRLPDPHCMLVQASQSKSDHLLWRDTISDMLSGKEQQNRMVAFDAAALLSRVQTEEHRWEKWFHSFDRSRNRVRWDLRGIAQSPGVVTWDEVKGRLAEVFSFTRLKIVNSDDDVGTSLDFETGWSPDGPVPRQDTYVIIVGGQGLSRGITIQGLCTTYYSREPQYADTTLQLSRWFGYRGKHLEFCRLFITEQMHSTLLDVHENDQDYRFRLATISNKYKTLEEARIALRESPSNMLTAKSGFKVKRYRLSFSPHTVLFTRVEVGDLAEQNEAWAASVLADIKSHGYKVVKSQNGDDLALLSPGWTAEQVANFLDGISLTDHNPDKAEYPTPEFYRDTNPDRPISRLLDTYEDPYVVAAYLRYWGTSDRFDAPTFNIAIPYGSRFDADPFDFPLLDRAISQDSHKLRESWTAQSYVDGVIPYIDSPPHDLINTAGHRALGCDGLLVLYMIHKDAIGHGSGIRREYHTPAFGIAIPAGGPPFQVAANYDINH